jgi:hypothetical protein
VAGSVVACPYITRSINWDLYYAAYLNEQVFVFYTFTCSMFYKEQVSQLKPDHACWAACYDMLGGRVGTLQLLITICDTLG